MPEQEQLALAITAIRRGESAQGRHILVSLLKANPKNELAWLWLVRAVPNDDQRITVLEQCLKVNPNSETARRALEQLHSRKSTGLTLDPPSKPITPEPLPGRPKTTPLPAVPTTPLSDRLAQVDTAGEKKPQAESAVSESPPLPEEALRSVTIRRYDTPVPERRPRRKFPMLFFLQLLLGIFLLSLITLLGWLALGFWPNPQQDLAHKALVSTVSALETQNAGLQYQVFQRQTQMVLQSTPMNAPTRTPQATPTLPATPTSLPIQAGAVSLTGPENVATLTQSSILPGTYFSAVTFSPDGSLLAGSSSQGITIWDAHSLEQVRQIFLENAAETVTFSPDSSALYFSQIGESNTSYLFGAATVDFNSLMPAIEFPGSTVDLFIMPDISAVVRVSSANSANIFLVKPENGEILSTLDHTGGLLAASLDPRSGLLATSGYNNLIQIWDLESQQVKTVLSAHTANVTTLAFSPDGALLASASQDGVVLIWDVENWELALTLTEDTPPVQVLAFTPDHRVLLFADVQGQITAWDTATADSLASFSSPPGLKDLAFSVDGAVLALAGDQSIEIWTLPEP